MKKEDVRILLIDDEPEEPLHMIRDIGYSQIKDINPLTSEEVTEAIRGYNPQAIFIDTMLTSLVGWGGQVYDEIVREGLREDRVIFGTSLSNLFGSTSNMWLERGADGFMEKFGPEYKGHEEYDNVIKYVSNKLEERLLQFKKI